jgi:hypothetical protein
LRCTQTSVELQHFIDFWQMGIGRIGQSGTPSVKVGGRFVVRRRSPCYLKGRLNTKRRARFAPAVSLPAKTLSDNPDGHCGDGETRKTQEPDGCLDTVHSPGLPRGAVR